MDAVHPMAQFRKSGRLYGTDRVEVFSAVHGLGVRAVVAVSKGDVVMVEEPLFTAPAGQSYFSAEKLMDPVFRMRPRVIALHAALHRLEQRFGHLAGEERFPPEAREVRGSRCYTLARSAAFLKYSVVGTLY